MAETRFRVTLLFAAVNASRTTYEYVGEPPAPGDTIHVRRVQNLPSEVGTHETDARVTHVDLHAVPPTIAASEIDA